MNIDITTEVKSIQSKKGHKVVTVELSGPKFIPDGIRALRARGRALWAVGLAPSSIDTISDIAVGDIQRMTRVSVSGRVVDQGTLSIREEYEIRVKG